MVPTGNTVYAGCNGIPRLTPAASYGSSGLQVGTPTDWQFRWFANKVSSGSATQIALQAQYSNTTTPTLYGQVLYIIPAGTLSDNEAVEFASTMNSVDFNCAAGSVCNVAGHRLQVDSYGTLTNCSSGASPAVCGSAASGSVAVPTGATPTLVVNTTAVTANSQILLTIDESLGTKLSVTCNTTLATLVQPVVTARTAGTSFTIQINATLATNPACVSYTVIN